MSFILFLLSVEPIQFYVDPVVYRSTVEIVDTIAETKQKQHIYYLEFNCGIPYQELPYETIDSAIVARVKLAFKLVNLDRPDSLNDTLYRQFTIPSFRYAAQQQLSFIIQFGLHIPEGNFRYMVGIASGDKRGNLAREIQVCKDDYRMSDILVADNIVIDTLGDELRKGDLKVYPRPSRRFNERQSNIYFYYEMYDLVPDSNRLKINYVVQDSAHQVIAQIPRQVDKQFASQAINFALSTKDLEQGRHYLAVEVRDEKNELLAQKETSFEIIRTPRRKTSFEGMPYYEEVEYFLTQKEYSAFQNFSKDGRKRFLDRFWSQHNYFEIARRFEYTDEHFREGNVSGHDVDRGRIYIKYGEPDDVERNIISVEISKPYEFWQYYNGYQFIFIDIRGTNEYTLVWTNASDEQSQPSLYKYIPESLLGYIE